MLSATWPDGERWTSPLAPLSGVVTRGAGVPVQDALVFLAITGDTVSTDSLGRFELHPVVPGRQEIVAMDTSNSARARPRATRKVIDVVQRDTTRVLLEIPRDATHPLR